MSSCPSISTHGSATHLYAKGLVRALAFAGMAVIGTSTSAQVPNAIFQLGAANTPRENDLFSPGSVNGDGGNQGVAPATDSASASSSLTVLADGSGSAGSRPDSGAEILYFGIVNFSPSTPSDLPPPQVTLVITASATAEATGTAEAGSGVEIGPIMIDPNLGPGFSQFITGWEFSSTTTVVGVAAQTQPSTCLPVSCGDFNTAEVSVPTGELFGVIVTASGGGSPGNTQTAAYSASADPFIQIEPTFLAEHPGLTLELSPNIEQHAPGASPSSIPEPSTWAMMLLGFAGLGFVGYRKAQKKAAIAA
jgi:hypothetical protein